MHDEHTHYTYIYMYKKYEWMQWIPTSRVFPHSSTVKRQLFYNRSPRWFSQPFAGVALDRRTQTNTPFANPRSMCKYIEVPHRLQCIFPIKPIKRLLITSCLNRINLKKNPMELNYELYTLCLYNKILWPINTIHKIINSAPLNLVHRFGAQWQKGRH